MSDYVKLCYLLAALLLCKFAYELHFYAYPQQSMDILGVDVHDTVSSEYFVFLSLVASVI